jgi:hypothetical protein
VQQSFALKAESERLLAIAKRAVEIAIETDEQTAMAYINDQTGVQTWVCTPKVNSYVKTRPTFSCAFVC